MLSLQGFPPQCNLPDHLTTVLVLFKQQPEGAVKSMADRLTEDIFYHTGGRDSKYLYNWPNNIAWI